MPEYTTRNVTVIDLSNPQRIQIPEVYQPQSCIIKIGNYSTDIGSRCYSIREINRNGIASRMIKNNQGIGVIRVVIDSLDERRLALIKVLIEYLAERAKSANHSTVHSESKCLQSFFQYYFSQTDLDYFDIKNRPHYEEAARRYSAKLLSEKEKKTSTKYRLTRAVFMFAEFLYDEVELNVYDYNIIASSNQNKDGTIPLLPEEHDLALALRTAIFKGVADLLVNNQPLPYPLKVPEVLGELNNEIWLGYSPWEGPCYFPRHHDFHKHAPREWFDRDKGALISKKQWLDRTDHPSRKSGYDSWDNIQRNLSVANQDHSKLKIRLAEYAIQCFLDLLISMTGMNMQPALDLPWYGGYFIQKTKLGSKTITLLKLEDQNELAQVEEPNIYLRSIKNRKGYQPIEVTISSRFLPHFKRYLQLRDYYLSGRTDARLFPVPANLMRDKRYSLHLTFSEIPRLGARKARAGVSDSLLTAIDDPDVASEILQNDPKTIIKHYMAGTQKAHIQGVGGFFNTLGNQIKISRMAVKNEIETAVGSCNNGGAQPDSLPDAPIEANCTQQEGCFFCKHYFVHADEIDIRKLVSILYYINKGAPHAHVINFFNELFELIIKRIKELLEQIEAISEQKQALVAIIKEEVFVEEALDDYWLGKLNRLEMFMGEY